MVKPRAQIKRENGGIATVPKAPRKKKVAKQRPTARRSNARRKLNFDVLGVSTDEDVSLPEQWCRAYAVTFIAGMGNVINMLVLMIRKPGSASTIYHEFGVIMDNGVEPRITHMQFESAAPYVDMITAMTDQYAILYMPNAQYQRQTLNLGEKQTVYNWVRGLSMEKYQFDLQVQDLFSREWVYL